MKPVPTETMLDMLEAKNQVASPKDSRGVRMQRKRMEGDAAGFTKQLIELEREFQERVERWEEKQREKRRRKARAEHVDAGTERALEVCVTRLEALKEEAREGK